VSISTLTPATRKELVQLVASATSLGIHRSPLKWFGRPSALWREEGDAFVVAALPDRAIISFSPEDQVVVVGGGMRVSELQAGLGAEGYGLPIGPGVPDLALSDAIALDLPHGLESQHGSWRSWVLGMTILLADGNIVTAGSRAVKNVAGYDLHKLFIGARGTLGVLLDVTLRVTPTRAVAPTLWRPTRREGFFPTLPGGGWIQRTLATDFMKAVEKAGDQVVAIDPASSVFWATLPPDQDLPRYRGDAVLRAHSGDKNLRIEDTMMQKFMLRAKAEFDPTDKLNAGEFF